MNIQFSTPTGEVVTAEVDLRQGVTISEIDTLLPWQLQTVSVTGSIETTDWLGNLPKPKK